MSDKKKVIIMFCTILLIILVINRAIYIYTNNHKTEETKSVSETNTINKEQKEEKIYLGINDCFLGSYENDNMCLHIITIY